MSTTSAQRLRLWYNIVQMLYKCFVLDGEWSNQTSTYRCINMIKLTILGPHELARGKPNSPLCRPVMRDTLSNMVSCVMVFLA